MYIERLSFDELWLVTNAMHVIRPLTLLNLLCFEKKRSPPPPPRKPSPLPHPPKKKTTRNPKNPPSEAQVLRIGQQLILRRGAPPWTSEGLKVKQPQQPDRRKEPPSLQGDESPDHLLGEQVY